MGILKENTPEAVVKPAAGPVDTKGMSKLDALIAELCPDGVEYKLLGDIGSIVRGSGLQKKDFVDSGVGCIHYGQIYTYYKLFTTKTKSFVTKELSQSLKSVKTGDLIIACTSENIEDVCKCVTWLGKDTIVTGGHSAILHHNQNPKYVAYFFQSSLFFKQKIKIATGTKVIEVSPSKMEKIKIPVPPLPVQEEIVRILDTFSELTAELTAELTKRKQQYQYYSKQIILNSNNNKSISLCDLGAWSGGKTPSMAKEDYWNDGYIPWVSSKDMKFQILSDTIDHITKKALTETSMRLYPKNSILMVTRSGILKHTLPISYTIVEVTINQDIKALIPRSEFNNRYIALTMQAFSEDIRQFSKKEGGTVDSLEFSRAMAFKIPVPPLAEQERIVSILDRFDALCNDLTSGLPAEIEARKKQYEYYRDKLLTFKELSA